MLKHPWRLTMPVCVALLFAGCSSSSGVADIAVVDSMNDSSPPDIGVECLVDSDCDDHIGCTIDICSSGSCSSTPDNGLCGSGESCAPDKGGCFKARSCFNDNDCNDYIVCTVEGCNQDTNLCETIYDDARCPGNSVCAPLLWIREIDKQGDWPDPTPTTPYQGCIPTTHCESDDSCPFPPGPCLDSACVAGLCAAWPLAEGESCADGTRCNGDETCYIPKDLAHGDLRACFRSGIDCDAPPKGWTSQWQCSPGFPVICNDNNECSKDTCIPETGQCDFSPSDDDAPCTNGVCKSGVCQCAHLECDGACCLQGARCHEGQCCNPNCQNRECGDDGCGQTCGTCPNLQDVCSAGQCQCVPDCNNKECGTDGCGGTCGQCTAAQTTCVNGQCKCQPKCDGKECEGDGCGGDCGFCPPALPTCMFGQCICVPDCDGKECGLDGCGSVCGDCQDGEYCEAGTCVFECGNGQCDFAESCLSCPFDCGDCCGQGGCQLSHGETPCTCPLDCGSPCSGKACGDNGCQGTCGTCPGLQDECMSNQCICIPACEDRICGDDGCNGTCGTCPGPQDVCLANGTCQCLPDCTNRECGDDGCGGHCGPLNGLCPGSQDLCLQGSCVCQPDCTGKECWAADGCGSSCENCFASMASGGFWMGSPSGCPAPDGYPGSCEAETGRNLDEDLHYVVLTHPFLLQKTEVTQGEWKTLFSGWNPSAFSGCGDQCPLESVNWYESVAYANLRSLAAGKDACYQFNDVVCRQGGNPSLDTDYSFCMDSTHGGIDSAKVSLNGVATPYECEGYRLPTEAEWEYAVRAGSATAFYPSVGNDGTASVGDSPFTPLDPNLDKIGWYGGNSTAVYAGAHDCSGWFPGSVTCGPHPVAEKDANAWGLFDMSGNVREWTWDLYGAYQLTTPDTPLLNPAGSTTGSKRVYRGGGWAYYSKGCRSSHRYNYHIPSARDYYLGFRLCRTSP